MTQIYPHIALCFSGQARAARHCFKSLRKNILKTLNEVDVFIHTWNVDNESKKKYDNPKTKTVNIFDCSVQDYLNMYSPVRSSVEDFESTKYVNNVSPAQKYRIMYYSIFKSNELKTQYEIEKRFKYDYVIRCRPDLFFVESLTLSHLAGLTDSSVLIPRGMDNGGINDQFAVGTSVGMDKYCSLHMYLESFSGGIYSKSQNSNAEYFLKTHIQNVSLEIQRFNILYNLVKFDPASNSVKYFPTGKYQKTKFKPT